MDKWFAVLGLVLLTGLVSGDPGIEFSPDSMDLSISSGDEVTKSVDVTYLGDSRNFVELDSTVLNGSGEVAKDLNVSFSSSVLILDSGESKTVDIVFDSSHALRPGNFSVGISGSTEVERVVESGGGSGSTVVVDGVPESEVKSLEEELNKTLDELDSARSDAEKVDELRQEIEGLEGNNSRLLERISELESENVSSVNQSDPIREDDSLTGSFDASTAGLIGVVLLLLFLSIIFYVRYSGEDARSLFDMEEFDL